MSKKKLNIYEQYGLEKSNQSSGDVTYKTNNPYQEYGQSQVGKERDPRLVWDWEGDRKKLAEKTLSIRKRPTEAEQQKIDEERSKSVSERQKTKDELIRNEEKMRDDSRSVTPEGNIFEQKAGLTPADRDRRIEAFKQLNVEPYTDFIPTAEQAQIKSLSDKAEADYNVEKYKVAGELYRKKRMQEVADQYRSGQIDKKTMEVLTASVLDSYNLPEEPGAPRPRSAWQQATLPALGAFGNMLLSLPTNIIGLGAGAVEALTPLDNVAKPVREWANRQSRDIALATEQGQASQAVRPGENSVITNLSSGAGSLAASLATSILTGKTDVPAVIFGAQAGAEQQRKAAEAGASGNNAFVIGLLGGLAEGGLEKVGLDKYLEANGGAVSKLFNRAVTEGMQEFTQDMAQSGVTDIYSNEVDYATALVNATASFTYGAILGAGADLALSRANAEQVLVDAGLRPEDVKKQVDIIEKNVKKELPEPSGDDIIKQLQSTEAGQQTTPTEGDDIVKQLQGNNTDVLPTDQTTPDNGDDIVKELQGGGTQQFVVDQPVNFDGKEMVIVNILKTKGDTKYELVDPNGSATTSIWTNQAGLDSANQQIRDDGDAIIKELQGKDKEAVESGQANSPDAEALWENKYSEKAIKLAEQSSNLSDQLKTAKAADKPAIQAQLDEVNKQSAQLETDFETESKQSQSDTITSMNPTGGLLVDYTPDARMKAKLADNITTIDKTMGGNPDDMITIYRGAPSSQKKIAPGDFVTTSRELAQSYTGDGNVLEMQVRKADVLDDKNEPLGDEYIYRPTTPSRKKGSMKPINKRIQVDEPKKGYTRYELKVDGQTVYADYNPKSELAGNPHIEFKGAKNNPVSETGYKSYFPNNIVASGTEQQALQELAENFAKKNKTYQQSKKKTSSKKKGSVRKITKGKAIQKEKTEEKKSVTASNGLVVSPKYIQEYADFISSLDENATGGYLVPDGEQYGNGYKRVSEHSEFYREYFRINKRKPSKQAWYDEAQRQIESGEVQSDFLDYIASEQANVYTSGDAMAEITGTDRRSEFTYSKTPEDLIATIERLNRAGMKNAILRRGQLKSNKALGLFSHYKTQGKESIKIQDKVIVDAKKYVMVLAHELGHAIQYNITGNTRGTTYKMLGSTDHKTDIELRTELRKVVNYIEGVDVSKLNQKQKDYLYRPTEMWARFVELWMIEETTAREMAPTVTKGFEKLIISEQSVRDLVDAMEGNLDKKWKNITPAIFKDRRQIYQTYLGKSAGKVAYDAEIIRRAEIQHAERAIEKLIDKKFKGVKDSPEALFRAAEAIEVDQKSGEIVYGTTDYKEVLITDIEKDPTIKKELEDMGYKFSHQSLQITNNGAEPVFVFTKQRYSSEQAKQMLNELTPAGRKLIEDFNASKEDAKDEFNRNFLKDLYGIDTKLEGWVHHYFDKRPIFKNSKAPLKSKVAASRRQRTGTEGYVEDFRKSITKAMMELEKTRINNVFIKKQLARISKPIAKGAKADSGWTEVIYDDKYGLRLPGESRSDIMIQTVLEQDDMREALGAKPEVINTTKFMKPVQRYQIPTELVDYYRSVREVPKEMSKIVKSLNLLGKYWTVNVLVHPGTAATNFISGGLQYAGKFFNDFYMDLLTLDLTFKKTRQNFIAPFVALTPRGFNRAPDWLWGGYRSSYLGQLSSDKSFEAVDQYGDKALKVFSAFENYWKRAISLSEGVDFTKAKQSSMSRQFADEEKQMIAVVNDAIDLWAYDYDNKPLWMDKWAKNGGSLAKPFMTYPYKYTKMIATLATGAVDRSLSWQERMSKVLSLGSLLAIAQILQSGLLGQPETPEGDEKTPYQLRPGGRWFIGIDKEGRELFLRTAKYPFFNLLNLGKSTLTGDWQQTSDIMREQFGTTGLGLDLFLLAIGRKSEFDQYKPTDAILGEKLSSLIPLFRITQDISQLLDTDENGDVIQRKTDNFIQGFLKPIPIFGSEKQRAKLRGDRRTIDIPIEPKEGRKISEKPGTTTRDLTRESTDLWLSMLAGIYISRINPKEAKSSELRNIRNKAEDTIRAYLREGNEADANAVAEEYGFEIPKGTYDYYRRILKK